MKYIIDIDEEYTYLNEVGRKAYNLHLLKKNNIPIPKTLVLSKSCAEYYLNFNNIKNPIEQKEKILTGVFPPEISHALENALKINLSNQKLVCRSSSLNEDSEFTSFAGQFTSIIGICSFEQLIQAVKICWYNNYNQNISEYSNYFGVPEALYLPLIIQSMVLSRSAGVAFFDAINNKLIIESNWGLGMSVVDGSTTPDKFIIYKDEISIQIKKKAIAFFSYEGIKNRNTGDVVFVKINDVDYSCNLIHVDAFDETALFQLGNELKEKASIEVDEAKAINDLACKIYDLFNVGIDIEWTFDFSGRLLILQARPITATINFDEGNVEVPTFSIIGVPSSPGQYIGNAKVIKDTTDFNKVMKGDILVCRSTNSSFMNVMKLAGGIITEEGGILSHTAIVSREMGIPCITEVKDALNRIKDLDLIMVNGTKGVISYDINEFNTDKAVQLKETIYKYEEITFHAFLLFYNFKKERNLTNKDISYEEFEDYILKISNIGREKKVLICDKIPIKKFRYLVEKIKNSEKIKKYFIFREGVEN
ncbi:PEP/pyruvate-binding domain-containing protein [Paenibacillus sp. FSL R10-2734]|uniref:PEP/pyruvate-binding domain-containing protein n=1 Tax=Paenibacillus sp. FSL R10-2734 TaxID=2954691 RepID=UPI0030DC80AA